MNRWTYFLIVWLVIGVKEPSPIRSQTLDSAYAFPVESPLIDETHYQFRGGLDNAYWKFVRTRQGRVAFLGGSITYNPGWRDSVMQYLERRFPQTEFEFIAAGIPSMGSTPGAFRLERDVLKDGPVDLLFEEAAVNDAVNDRTPEEQICGMEGIVRRVRKANLATDIVLMYFVDPDKMEDYRKGRHPEVIRNHEQVAEHYNLSSINLAREVTDRIDAGEFTWEDDFRDLHPSPFGQGVYARSIIGFLEIAWNRARLETDQIQAEALPEKLHPDAYDAGKLEEVRPEMEQSGWAYDSVWRPQDGAGTRSNYTAVPMLIGSEPGEIFRYPFVGRAVGIAVAAGPDAGVVEYRIDGGEWQTQNLFTPWSSQLHLPWYYTLARGLAPGKHLLEIRLTDLQHPDSTGRKCRIRYFYVNE